MSLFEEMAEEECTLRARIAELESRCETCDHVERICQAERRAMDAEDERSRLRDGLIELDRLTAPMADMADAAVNAYVINLINP